MRAVGGLSRLKTFLAAKVKIASEKDNATIKNQLDTLARGPLLRDHLKGLLAALHLTSTGHYNVIKNARTVPTHIYHGHKTKYHISRRVKTPGK